MIVKNTYKHITKEEKIQLYIRIMEQIYYKEKTEDEENCNLLSTEYRQKRKY